MELVPLHKIDAMSTTRALARSLFREASENRSPSSSLPLTDAAIEAAFEDPTSVWMMGHDDGCWVGLVGIQRINLIDRSCEMGISTVAHFRRKGIGLKMCQQMRDWAINTLGIRRTQSTVLADSPVIGLAEKMGDVREGVLRQARYKNGKFIDAYVYGWVKE